MLGDVASSGGVGVGDVVVVGGAERGGAGGVRSRASVSVFPLDVHVGGGGGVGGRDL